VDRVDRASLPNGISIGDPLGTDNTFDRAMQTGDVQRLRRCATASHVPVRAEEAGDPFGGAGALPQLAAWWDAADANSIVSSAGKVSRWSDKSGNGYHATQATGALQPDTGLNTINGKNAIAWGGFADQRRLDTNLPGNPSRETIFAVFVDRTNIGYPNTLLGPDTAGGRNYRIEWDGTQLLLSDVTFGIGAGTLSTSYGTPNLGVVQRVDGGLWSIRLNGVADQFGLNSNHYVTGAVHSCIGSPVTSGGESPNLDIGELIVCSGILSESDVATVENYLKAKWGLP
jgi:hypothetical protein